MGGLGGNCSYLVVNKKKKKKKKKKKTSDLHEFIFFLFTS